MQNNAEGQTVVLVTHDPKSGITDRAYYLYAYGKIENELKLQKYDGTDDDTRMQKVTQHMMALGI